MSDQKKLGIKETKEVLDLGFSALDIAVNIGKSGSNISTLLALGMPSIIATLGKVNLAIEDIDQVDDELKDLDENEIEELLQFASKRINKTFSSALDLSPYIKFAKSLLTTYKDGRAIYNLHA